MRPSQKQNRARGRGSRKPNGNMVNRVFESAGPEGKVRGTPQQIVDKYLTLARDAQTSGDRVTSENFLQHAEHYQRILLDAQGVRDDRRDQRGDSQDGSDADGRDDSGSDEGEEAQAERQRDDRQDDRQRDDRQRDDRQRDDRQDDRAASGQGGREDGGERQHESEVGGLTTIDSGAEDNQNLLVEADELSASQPPRRKRNQRRSQSQQSEPAEADNQGE